MNKKGLFGLIIVAIILLIIGFFWFVKNQMDEQIIGGDKDEHGCLLMAGYTWNETEGECVREWERCVAASCCHATECVLENEAPNCSGSLCSMECRAGTLDCGQAQCEFIDGECGVVWNE